MSRLPVASWTAPGPNSTATDTYTSIKAALGSSRELAKYEFEVFLQGSYANATNIDGESDIDVVVMFTTIYQPNVEQLSSVELAAYQRDFVPASTTSQSLRDLVHRALVSYYPTGLVEARNKCLRVGKRPGYLDADVVPCIQHRRYISYPTWGTSRYIEGVTIEPLRGERITNFPKEHKTNGARRNGVAGGQYKPTVRQLKRVKRACANEGLFDPKDLPGYVLECLAYNAPSWLFSGDDTRRALSVLSWLKAQSPEELHASMKSCDEIHRLFEDDPGKHNQYTAHRILNAMWERV